LVQVRPFRSFIFIFCLKVGFFISFSN